MLSEVKGKCASYRFGYEEGRFSIFADTEKLKGISLVSLRDPVREAERHIGPFHLKPGMLAIVGGVAHLPMLEILVEQLQSPEGKGGFILAFEADTDLYLALKKSRPDIFSHIAVIVPENIPVIAELVEKLDVENFIGYRTFENKASIDLKSSFYANAIGDFKKKLASRFSDLFTRLEFEERWVFNSLSKLPLLDKARPVSALFGLGRGAEALIVSTGPSLRDSLAEIKKYENNYFIACADSAYRVLVRYGINPHLVFSLDSQAHTAKHFGLLPKGKPGAYPLLVCDAVSNPTVARDWRGEFAISFTAQFPDDRRVVSPGCDFLEDEKFFEGIHGIIPGDVQSGGSVATSIFDLMRLMEFDKIILVGQDLAYTRREIHTPGTHHTDEWLAKTTNRLQPLENINERVIRRRHTKRELSLTGKPIVTDYILSLYRDWFKTAFERLKLVVSSPQGRIEPQQIYNASADGLKIPGAIALSHLAPSHKFSVEPGLRPGSTGGDERRGVSNETILEKYLAAARIKTNPERIESLARRVQSAIERAVRGKDGLVPTANPGTSYPVEESQLSFLHYVGRKYAIKAMRAPEHKENLLARQKKKQFNFLKKMRLKLYQNG